MLYTIIKFGCIVAAIILGILMVVSPEKVVKKELREDAAKLKQQKLVGAVVVIIGVVVLAMQLSYGF